MPFYFWHPWVNKNNNVHNNKHPPLRYTLVLGQVVEYTEIILHKGNESQYVHHLNIKWEPTDDGKYKLNVDGASNGDTMSGGLGGVIRDHYGNWILGFM